MREAENTVDLQGILSEINLEEATYKNKKTNEEVDCIRGNVKIKVNQSLVGMDGKEHEYQMEIPVHCFANKYTASGKENPSYISLRRVMKEMISLGAAIDGVAADTVRVSGSQIAMNEYVEPESKKFSNTPRIKASFINKAKPEFYNEQATFVADVYIISMEEEEQNDGEMRFKISGVMPLYGGKVQVVDFYVDSPSVLNSIQQYWSEKDTVQMAGRLKFTSTQKKVNESNGFGETFPKTTTTFTNEFIITGGKQLPYEGEQAYTEEEITQALSERNARIEAEKNSKITKTTKKVSNTPSFDPGF